MNDRISITMLEDGIADVRMTRVDKMNALDGAQWNALVEAIDTLNATPGLRVVVLSGEGRAFCAGLDLSSLQSERDPGASSAGGTLSDRTRGIANNAQYAAWGWRELPVPVIAAVHGVAFGAGSQIMAAADIRIVHPDTRIAGDVETQPPQRVQSDAVVRGPARIIRVVHKAALARDDLGGQVFHCLHRIPPQLWGNAAASGLTPVHHGARYFFAGST